MAVSQRLRARTTVSEPAGADGRIHADIDPGARPRTADDAPARWTPGRQDRAAGALFRIHRRKGARAGSANHCAMTSRGNGVPAVAPTGSCTAATTAATSPQGPRRVSIR